MFRCANVPARPMRLFLVAVLLLPLALGAPAFAQTRGESLIPDTPQGRVVQKLLDTLASGDPARWRDFIVDTFADDFLKVAPMDFHVSIFGDLYDKSRGYRVHAFKATSEHRHEITVEANLTELWQQLIVTFEPGTLRLSGLGVRGVPPPATPPSAEPFSLTGRIRDLDAYLEKLAGADVFSGAVLLAREGRPVYARAFGEADKAHRVPNHLDTRFNLGSMNKMFTAVAIAQLVERGALSFDDPLSTHVSDVLDPETARRIKIKHLLSHSSGLGDYLDEMNDLPQARFRTLDDFLGLVKGDTLGFQPGEKFSYSNAGYLLLGRVIERVSGESYFDYLQNHIYGPAGMTSAGAEPQDSDIPRLAVGYDKEFRQDGVHYRNNRFILGLRGGPAGGGYATVLDLLRFSVSLQRGELLREDLVRLLTSAKPDVGSDRYGYGFTVDPQRNIAGHSGGFAGVGANLDIFQNDAFVGVVLSNYRGATGPVVSKIRELVAEATRTRSASR